MTSSFRPSKLFLYAMLLGLSTLFLSGCLGITQPKDSAIKEAVGEHFNAQYSGLLSAIQVEKINGYKQNDTHYVAQMRIIATAERSLDDYAKHTLQNDTLSPLEKMASTLSTGLLKLTLPSFVAGDQITFERDYLFIKTDNGWQLKHELTDSAAP
jgi:hypothetical protein